MYNPIGYYFPPNYRDGGRCGLWGGEEGLYVDSRSCVLSFEEPTPSPLMSSSPSTSPQDPLSTPCGSNINVDTANSICSTHIIDVQSIELSPPLCHLTHTHPPDKAAGSNNEGNHTTTIPPRECTSIEWEYFYTDPNQWRAYDPATSQIITHAYENWMRSVMIISHRAALQKDKNDDNEEDGGDDERWQFSSSSHTNLPPATTNPTTASTTASSNHCNVMTERIILPCPYQKYAIDFERMEQINLRTHYTRAIRWHTRGGREEGGNHSII
jgi:hypothetical protein